MIKKTDLVLVDADFSNDPLFPNETPNKFEGNISEKSNSDVISNVICRHNGSISSNILNECDKYVPNESNYSHISDVIVSDVGCSYEQCLLSRIPCQWYDESEGIASFPEAIREPVCPDMEFAQAENPNQVQDYPNEYEGDSCFPFDCFAGESSLDESHVLTTHINAYLSVYSNMKNKENMYDYVCGSQVHMLECLKLPVSVYPQILTYD
ncbi:unnamed protein product [Schistosoma mansoni]|uniref:Ovule protein n=1 Tax=Schistosoma mansoni TaxID=6183 RepID=G4M225_SCHMA|nr:unnamed protein product [Schistosoma mansoni]|eukprot:XP_018644760.1 unnamed protein product [Schistosoma mansoni]